jgi:putative endonuclease
MLNKFYYVYVLKLNNGQLYVGLTSDLKRRYNEHSKGKVKATRRRRPLELIYCEAYRVKKDAEKRERYLKSTKGKRTLKLQLHNYLNQ